jgi:hypothetical protein
VQYARPRDGTAQARLSPGDTRPDRQRSTQQITHSLVALLAHLQLALSQLGLKKLHKTLSDMLRCGFICGRMLIISNEPC